MEATTDLWEIAPERATRVGHPAPFPVELPKRLIELYTYRDDVVLDPFMGSGSTALAASDTGRYYIGFDTDPQYVSIAEGRVSEAREQLQTVSGNGQTPYRVELRADRRAEESDQFDDSHVRAIREGRQARDVAEALLAASGFENIRAGFKPRGSGITLSFVATDRTGGEWAFDVSGAFTSNRAGLKKTDTLWKSLGIASVLHESQMQRGEPRLPLILLTTDAPTKGTAGHQSLRLMMGADRPLFDLIELLDIGDHGRLRRYAEQGAGARTEAPNPRSP